MAFTQDGFAKRAKDVDSFFVPREGARIEGLFVRCFEVKSKIDPGKVKRMYVIQLTSDCTSAVTDGKPVQAAAGTLIGLPEVSCVNKLKEYPEGTWVRFEFGPKRTTRNGAEAWTLAPGSGVDPEGMPAPVAAVPAPAKAAGGKK